MVDLLSRSTTHDSLFTESRGCYYRQIAARTVVQHNSAIESRTNRLRLKGPENPPHGDDDVSICVLFLLHKYNWHNGGRGTRRVDINNNSKLERTCLVKQQHPTSITGPRTTWPPTLKPLRNRLVHCLEAGLQRLRQQQQHSRPKSSSSSSDLFRRQDRCRGRRRSAAITAKALGVSSPDRRAIAPLSAKVAARLLAKPPVNLLPRPSTNPPVTLPVTLSVTLSTTSPTSQSAMPPASQTASQSASQSASPLASPPASPPAS